MIWCYLISWQLHLIFLPIQWKLLRAFMHGECQVHQIISSLSKWRFSGKLYRTMAPAHIVEAVPQIINL